MTSTDQHTGMGKEKKGEPLSAETRETIREFIWRTLAVPAAFAFIISGIGGYALKAITDEQSSKGYHEAYAQANQRVVTLTEVVTTSKVRMDYAIRETDELLRKAQNLNEDLRQNQTYLKTTVDIKELSNNLSNNPQLINLLAKSATQNVVALDDKFSRLGTGEIAVAGFTGQARPPTGFKFQDATCPDGQYAAGVRGWGHTGSQCTGCFNAVEILCRSFPK